MIEKFFNKEEACAALGGISQRTLDRLVKDGQIGKPVRIAGRRLLFRKEVLEEFIARRLAESATDEAA